MIGSAVTIPLTGGSILINKETLAAFAPVGTLRASINVGNPILARRDPNGSACGVSVDLASELVRRLSVDLELVVFDTAGESVQAVTSEQAEIVRVASSPAVIETFLCENLDVATGVRQQLLADAHPAHKLRLLPGRFMQIRQAMGMPKSRGEQAARTLYDFVEEMNSAGFVEQALRTKKVSGAEVAPAGSPR